MAGIGLESTNLKLRRSAMFVATNIKLIKRKLHRSDMLKRIHATGSVGVEK